MRRAYRLARRAGSGVAAAILLALATTPASAQEFIGNFAYQYGLPGGDAKDFIDNDSWLGFLLEGDWFRSTNFALGGSIGWTELYNQRDGATFELPNGAINGRAYSHLGVLPILVRGRFVFGDRTSSLRPLIGVHAGTYYIRQTVDVGQFSAEESAWHLGIAPEAGFMYFLRSGLVMQVNARYNLPFEAGEYLGGEGRSWPYWGFSIGFGYQRGLRF